VKEKPVPASKVDHATFTITRDFKAPPARVFVAHTSRDAKMRWQAGGEGWETFEFTVDVRPGGREVWRGSFRGSPEIRNNVSYFDVVENERLIFGYEMYVGEKRISVSLATIEFEPGGPGTRLTFTEQGAYLDDPEAAANREAGTRALIEKLAKEVEG
jgi:uncharacterized protein YndB with AHSA1/START domain